MTLELEINAATKAFLPEGALELATAPQRFNIEHSHSDKPISCIRRIVPWKLDSETDEILYAVIFRREFSEKSTNFLHIESHDASLNLIDIEAAKTEIEDEFLLSSSHRIWQPLNTSITIGFDSSQQGIIYSPNQTDIRFRYKKVSNAMAGRDFRRDLEWFMMGEARFEAGVTRIFEDEKSEIRFAIDWFYLDKAQKNAYAFKCRNGSWDQFIQVVTWLLRAYIPHIDPEASETEWILLSIIFHSFSYLPQEHEILISRYRLVLDYFQPANLEAKHRKKGTAPLPLCVSEYVEKELQPTPLDNVTQHEIIEAHLQLAKWANTNLSTEAAKRFLDF